MDHQLVFVNTFCCRNLERFDISNNDISPTPEFMAALNRLGSLQQIDLKDNSSLPAALTQQPMDQAALQSALETLGESNENALTGGKFVSKPIATYDAKFGLFWGLASGYFDVYADVQVTIDMYNDPNDSTLFWISVACMVLAVAVQCILVDTSHQRRLMSVLHVKLLVDAYRSFTGGHINAGYGTAKFVEAVYESTIEGLLQSYKVLRDLQQRDQYPSVLLVLSIVASWNSIALVLNMFLDAQLMENLQARKWQRYLWLYAFHFFEIASRTVSLACLATVHETYFFVSLAGALLLRLTLRCIDADENTSVGLAVASLFIDSVWNSKSTFRRASLLTVVESSACISLYAWQQPRMLVIVTVATLLLVSKVILHFLVMEQRWNRRFEIASRRGSAVESRLPGAEVENPMQSKRDKQVLRAVADANTATGVAGFGRRLANMAGAAATV